MRDGGQDVQGRRVASEDVLQVKDVLQEKREVLQVTEVLQATTCKPAGSQVKRCW